MYSKILAMIAATAILSACSSAPEEESTASGSGGASATTTQTASSSAPAAQPAGPVPGSQDDLIVNVGDRVFFDFDKYDITPVGRTTLERQAAWLKKFPSVTIAVEGHCDERGTREYNLALGERRANAIKDYLSTLGVSPNRVQTISYGKERPVALGSTEASWAENRRGVTIVKSSAGS